MPEIKDLNEVQVKMQLGGICTSDLHMASLEISMFASIMANPRNPFPMGHELVGEVCGAGENVKSIKQGDRVVLLPAHRGVSGAGIIGLMVVAELRSVGSKSRIITLSRYPFQEETVRTMGADEVINEPDTNVLYERVAELTGARVSRPTRKSRPLGPSCTAWSNTRGKRSTASIWLWSS